ncbi:chaperonin 10-like protein [Neohortaea acidophila]|uniref:Chaperonin 10-like protein n=1 Tax=Neohortaea acidophila TaxID=245834 RepID=A0A6A6PH18_9PEZI|nr:chaperonin 10-like protein [Neohortaea acidophila]KAF2479289.1 chaperonin 10-like protein [Neohortaea acidophila]
MASKIPTQQRALVLQKFGSDIQLQHVPTPQLELGTVIVRVSATTILSYQRGVYDGSRGLYGVPTPLVIGISAIGRVAGLPADATLLEEGQLVYVDCVVRGRDDPSALFLSAIHAGSKSGSKKLMADVYRDGSFAEYMRAPLENCIPLDETRLCKTLGYPIHDLMYMSCLLVSFGGLRDIGLEPGETVVVSPATGNFGGAGVLVAVAMGARVIAMGRNTTELARLKELAERGKPGACVETVPISGDEETDTAALKAFGTIDAVLDLTPPIASKSTHLKSAISALRHSGRVSLMGFPDLSASMWHVVGSNIVMKGKLMYSREDMLLFVKMLERGLFPKAQEFVDTKAFALEQWEEALDVAARHTGLGRQVIFVPEK